MARHAAGERGDERPVDVTTADDRPTGPESGTEHQTEQGRWQEAALVWVDFPDVDQKEEGHTEGADRDQGSGGPRQGKDKEEKEEESKADPKRRLGSMREVGKEGRHHRNSQYGLIGEGCVTVQPP